MKESCENKMSGWVGGDAIQDINHFVWIWNNWADAEGDDWREELHMFCENNNYPKSPISKEELYECILDNLPMGYQLKAGIVTNYLQLKTMWNQRKNHKLSHWNKDFVQFVKDLPMSELITGE